MDGHLFPAQEFFSTVPFGHQDVGAWLGTVTQQLILDMARRSFHTLADLGKGRFKRTAIFQAIELAKYHDAYSRRHSVPFLRTRSATLLRCDNIVDFEDFIRFPIGAQRRGVLWMHC